MYPGKESPVSVSLDNPTSEEVDAEVSIEVPKGWSSENGSTVLPPSRSETVEVPVTPPTSLEDEEYIKDTLRVTLSSESGQVYGTPREVQVIVVPEPEGSNIALSAQASASSTIDGFAASNVIDGNNSSVDWPGTGWNDGTRGEFPDTLKIQFNERRRVGRVDFYTLGSDRYPASQFGLKDWNVQVLVDGEWETIREVRDNDDILVISEFEPIETSAVRIRALASNGGTYSRIVELEVYAG